jgi:uncharacterized membrane protein YfcA
MTNIKNSTWLKSPRLEIIIMISSVILSYFGLAILGAVPEPTASGTMSTSNVVLIQFAFFLLSVAIALISVIAGIGGGVIFTPIMLAFTSVNSIVVRGTGLIVAMFSGLISTGIFIKKGLSNYRIALVLTLSQAAGALAGATMAISMAENAGDAGEGILRTALGFILVALALYFMSGGKKLEHPKVGQVDRFTKWLRLDGVYYEESERKLHDYKVKRAWLGILLIFGVGLIGGFFGMGGGWAITPVLNMGMGIPLKLAAANSGVILGIGSCVSVWPYIFAGGVIPFFVLPWLAGQVVGGFVGSYVLARIKVATVRLILIGIMFFTSFGLITKGLNVLGVIGNVPASVQVVLFVVIITAVIVAVIIDKKKVLHETLYSYIEEKQPETEAPVVKLPASNIVYANTVHWITIISSIGALFTPILILINPANNVLNPNDIFKLIFSGATPAEIWQIAQGGGFPGAHYYFDFLTKADSWAQFAINLGCSVGLWALIPTVVLQSFKEKDRFYGFLGLLLAAMIMFAMLGIIK